MTSRSAIPSAVLVILSAAIGPGQDVVPATEAPPSIAQHGVVNLASRMPARLAGGAIGRGSLLSIRGFRLGPMEPVRASGSALAPSLAGVSVRIKQGALETDALPVMVSATEIHALLPVSVPPGEIEVRVVRNGQESRTPAKLRIVESSFGAFSRNGRGWGPGEIRNGDGRRNSLDHPAKPAQMVTLRGTGLGVVEPQSIQVVVGNREARATSVRPAGAQVSGQEPGVDEIAFAIPADAPKGCYVPVRVRSGGYVSNTVAVTIAGSDGSCSTAEDWMEAQTNQPGKLAILALIRIAVRLVVTRREKADYLMDVGYANFEVRTSAHEQNPYYLLPPAGTCTTLAGSTTLSSLIRPEATLVPAIGALLDPGSITVQGADGSRKLRAVKPVVLGGNTPWPQAQSKRFPLLLAPGDFTFSTAGGREMGPFSTTIRVGATIDWTNRDGIANVDRERGVTVKWRAASPKGWVLITAVNSDEDSGGAGLCSCIERASAGSFHVPPNALANIPPTPAEPAGWPTNMLIVAELPGDDTARTTSSGSVDHVVAFFASASARNVSFR